MVCKHGKTEGKGTMQNNIESAGQNKSRSRPARQYNCERCRDGIAKSGDED